MIKSFQNTKYEKSDLKVFIFSLNSYWIEKKNYKLKNWENNPKQQKHI